MATKVFVNFAMVLCILVGSIYLTLALVLSIIAYFAILPSLDLMENPRLHWIIRVARNLVPHVICAGLLHLAV